MDEILLKTQHGKPWFAEGLRFTCTGCGGCCSGSPGYVFLSYRDLERLANHFSLSQKDFIDQYTQKVDDRLALLDHPGSYDCIFLSDKKCTVYASRPTQCRTFPWWIHHLREPSDWEEAKQRCEGIDHPEAAVVPSLIIEEQYLTYLDNLIEQNFY